jgi:hypothetical protein
VINRFVGKPRRRHGSFGVDRVGVSELRLAELAAGGMVDLGSCCPPVRVVIRAIQLVCGTRSSATGDGIGLPCPVGRFCPGRAWRGGPLVCLGGL